MAIAEALLEWSRATFLPAGAGGLFALAFIESSFFPIPPDIILIPLCLLNPAAALLFAAVCTAGSVAGAVFGYWIGLKGGRPALLKFVANHRIKKVEGCFNRWGVWAIVAAALTPIPYKIFTITSGVLRFDLRKMLLASVAGRGARFFAEAAVLAVWGEQILAFALSYFELFTVALIAAAIAGYFIWRAVKRPASSRAGAAAAAA